MLGAQCVGALPEMVAEEQCDIILVFKGNTEEWGMSQQD